MSGQGAGGAVWLSADEAQDPTFILTGDTFVDCVAGCGAGAVQAFDTNSAGGSGEGGGGLLRRRVGHGAGPDGRGVLVRVRLVLRRRGRQRRAGRGRRSTTWGRPARRRRGGGRCPVRLVRGFHGRHRHHQPGRLRRKLDARRQRRPRPDLHANQVQRRVPGRRARRAGGVARAGRSRSSSTATPGERHCSSRTSLSSRTRRTRATAVPGAPGSTAGRPAPAGRAARRPAAGSTCPAPAAGDVLGLPGRRGRGEHGDLRRRRPGR